MKIDKKYIVIAVCILIGGVLTATLAFIGPDIITNGTINPNNVVTGNLKLKITDTSVNINNMAPIRSSNYETEAFKKELDQFNAVIGDIVACFVSREDLKTALATPIPSFKDFANIVTRLVQSTPNWQKKPVDVFLQYQWSPSGDNDKTYLELPKNVKHGSFIIASEGVGFKEIKTPTSLKYVKEDGTEHTFKRGEWFLESAFANQVNLTGASTMNSTTTASTGAAW